MDSVSADDQIEASLGPAAEGHVNSVTVLIKGSDCIVEEVLDVVAGRLVEQGRQISAGDLDVFGTHHGMQAGCRDACALTIAAVYESHALGVERVGPDGRTEAHSVDDVQRFTPDVDTIAACAQGGGLLNDGHLETASDEPVRSSRAGETGTGNQD